MFNTKFKALSTLAESAKKGEEITPEMIEAVNAEFTADSIPVQIMVGETLSALKAREQSLTSAHESAVQALAPDTKPEDVASANVAELAITALAAKDKKITRLQTELDGKGNPPAATKKPKGEQLETETTENPYLTSVDKELEKWESNFKQQ